MVYVDIERCTGCGICVGVCPQRAISLHNDLAVINQEQCIQCETCAEVCPVGAIRKVVPTHAQITKGGDSMVYGFGRGFGRRGGMGFGFRGSSPPWPYVGLGRGGLPRCGYFFSGAVGLPGAWPTPQAQAYWQAMQTGQAPYPSYGAPTTAPGTTPFAPQMTPEQELDFLKNQAEAIKGQLEQIEVRMRGLESEK